MSDAFTTRILNVSTGSAERVVDLTQDCETFLSEVAAGRDGLLNIFVPHATVSVAVIETGAGSDDDLLTALHSLLPADDRWQHRHGSPGHGRDHVLPALVPPHATLPVIMRHSGNGHVAVGVPGGYEQGQPRPSGAVELPRLVGRFGGTVTGGDLALHAAVLALPATGRQLAAGASAMWTASGAPLSCEPWVPILPLGTNVDDRPPVGRGVPVRLRAGPRSSAGSWPTSSTNVPQRPVSGRRVGTFVREGGVTG